MADSPVTEPTSPAFTEKPGTSRFRKAAGPAAQFVLVLIVIGFLHHEFQSLHYSDIQSSFRSLPLKTILLAVFLTVVNYVVVIGHDWFGLRLVEHRLTTGRLIVVSTLSYAFSNSLGVFLGRTPVRVRLYSAWGLNSSEVLRLIVYVGLAFWVGLFFLGGLLFVSFPFDVPATFGLPFASSRPAGGLMLIAAFACLAMYAIQKKPLHIRGINLQPPTLLIAVGQLLVASLDLLLASSVLFVLLPSVTDISFLSFTAVFVLAVIVAVISHIPGGLGVLELVLMTMLPHSAHSLIASLLAFRIIYYLVPLLAAVLVVSVASVRQHATHLSGAVKMAGQWAGLLFPRLITTGVFLSGVILLISGTLPSAAGRLELVRRVLPLPVVEISHFAGSIIGILLLALAGGLQRRIDTAWSLTLLMLGAGIAVSLTKGFDYEEAAILLILLLAMIPCRRHFYRKGALLGGSLSPRWLLSITAVLAVSVWMVFFSYRHVEFSGELWWQVAWSGEAPRAMRALVATTVAVVLLAALHLLRPQRRVRHPPSEAELRIVQEIVGTSESTYSNLALLGDKQFIFSTGQKTFVMFGCSGRSWIAMGDPVGPAESADDAAWQFREACDAQGVSPVFYQVDQATLYRYIEMGLSLIKLGEEARVDLSSFSLEGRSFKDLRRSVKKSSSNGLTFRLISQPKVPVMIPHLKIISDAWLSDKQAAEKGFSLGFFEPGYLSRFDVALASVQGVPLAFANIWKGASRQELSIDLMRHLPEAPNGVMEFLLVELMLWGRDNGYHYFNLGMAPLAGVDSRRSGPVWNQLSGLEFRHGERFYNFQGLQNYKKKFEPRWNARYLTSLGGISLLPIIADVSTLISGGLLRLFRRPREEAKAVGQPDIAVPNDSSDERVTHPVP